jgi:hypothetical protein
MKTICRQLRAERDEARRIAEHWHNLACSPFDSPGALPWQGAGIRRQIENGMPTEKGTDPEAGQDLRTERDRYKAALEGIAGFPHQYFDGETPWRMRDIAEYALSREAAEL